MNAHRLLPLLIAAGALFAQSARPEFEVASIRPADQSDPQHVEVGVHIDGAQVNIRYFALRDYIRVAYRLKDYQVSGPDWLTTEKFDISAKIPAGAKSDQVPDMLKSLLEDRFLLKTHMDSKEFPVYALIPGKGGIKLKEVPEDPSAPVEGPSRQPVNVTASGSSRGVFLNLGGGSSFSFSENKLEAKKLDMPRFCDTVARFMDKPVVDMTGLPGKYDVTLNMSQEDYTAMLVRSALNAGVTLPPMALRALEFGNGDSLAVALQQVGLKLESRKAPLPVLVVDRIEKSPTAN